MLIKKFTDDLTITNYFIFKYIYNRNKYINIGSLFFLNIEVFLILLT